MRDIHLMSLDEFSIRMKSAQLSRVDSLELVYENAWATGLVNGFDKNNKPLIKNRKDLFDYEKAVGLIKNEATIDGTSTNEELIKRRESYERAIKILEERRKLDGQ